MLLLLLQPNPFGSERSYWAEMDSAQGLATTGRDIRVAGVNVGEIGSVERDGDGARIELVLPKDISVHSDARVEMRPHLLFEGSSFVDLHLGSPSARALAPGAVIPRAQTSNYVTLDEALRVLRPRIRRDVAALSKAAATTLRGEAIEGLQRTLRAAPALTASLTGAARALQGPRRRELASTIRGTARTVEALAARERDLAPMLDRLARTTAGLATDNGAPLDAALARLPGTLRALDDAAPVLTNTIDRLDSFSAHAAPSLPALARALAGTRPVLGRAIPVLRRGTPVVRDAHRLATALAKADALTEMLRLIPKPLGDLDGMLKQLLERGAVRRADLRAARRYVLRVLGRVPLVPDAGPEPGRAGPRRPRERHARSEPRPPGFRSAWRRARRATRTALAARPVRSRRTGRGTSHAHAAKGRRVPMTRFSSRVVAVPIRALRLAREFVDPRLKAGRVPYARTVVVMLAIATLTFAGYTAVKKGGRLPLSDKPYLVDVILPDANGLDPGKGPAVGVAGINIGRVTAVRVEDGQARVTLRLPADMRGKIFNDATAYLRPSTVLQTLILNVTPGSPRSGTLARGAVIPAERTGTFVHVDKLTSMLDVDTQAQVQVLVSEAARGLRGREPQLRKILAELGRTTDGAATLTRALDDRRRLLARLMANLDRVMGTVGDRGEQFADALSLTSRTLRVSAAREPELRAVTRELAPTLDEATRALVAAKGLGNSLAPALDQLLPVSRNLKPLAIALDKVNAPFDQLIRSTDGLVRGGARPLHQLVGGLKGLDGRLRRDSLPALRELLTLSEALVESRDGLAKLANLGSAAALDEPQWRPGGQRLIRRIRAGHSRRLRAGSRVCSRPSQWDHPAGDDAGQGARGNVSREQPGRVLVPIRAPRPQDDPGAATAHPERRTLTWTIGSPEPAPRSASCWRSRASPRSCSSTRDSKDRIPPRDFETPSSSRRGSRTAGPCPPSSRCCTRASSWVV